MRKRPPKKSPIAKKIPAAKKRPLVPGPWVFFSIAGVLAFIAVLFFAVPYLIPSSTALNWLDENVGKAIGARVSAKGIRLRSFPYLGFTIDGLEIASNSEPFQGLGILTAGRVSGTLSVAGLLDGVVVTSIDAEPVAADLRIAGGQTNVGALLIPKGEGAAGSKLVIKSLNVSNGQLNVWKDNAQAASAGSIELSAVKLNYSNGAGANFEMKGRFAKAGGETTPASAVALGAAGQILLDEKSSTLFLRGIKTTVAAAHIASDASFRYAIPSAPLDIHMTSTNLNPGACKIVFAFLPDWASKFLSWQGIVSADVSVKSSSDGFEVTAGADASLAKFGTGKFFAKPSGAPFKAGVALSVTPDSIAINRGDVALGESSFNFSGSVMRDEKAAIKLNIRGEKLGDAALKAYFPPIALVDSITDLHVSSDVEGDLSSDAPFTVRGGFGAANLKVAGVALANAEGAFEHVPSPESGTEETAYSITFPAFKADLYGGSLSGNGIVSLGESSGFNFDLVTGRLDAANVPALGGGIAGEASLVVKATDFGNDAKEIEKNLALTGTLVAPSSAWAKAKPVSQLFSPETWEAIETATGVKLSEAVENKLGETDSTMENLSVSFSASANGADIGGAVWKNPQYEASLRGRLDPMGKIAGSGEIIVPKEIAAGLVPLASQKMILDGKGRLVLPVNFGGTPSDLLASFNQAKFSEAMKSRPAAAAKPEPPPQKAAAETKKQIAVVRPTEETVPAQKKIAPPVKPAEQKTRPPKMPSQSEEDILKVIIGE